MAEVGIDPTTLGSDDRALNYHATAADVTLRLKIG